MKSNFFFCAETMDRRSMYCLQSSERQTILDGHHHVGEGQVVFCPCKHCENQRNRSCLESIRMHFIIRGVHEGVNNMEYTSGGR